jgi:hypothetical protein
LTETTAAGAGGAGEGLGLPSVATAWCDCLGSRMGDGYANIIESYLSGMLILVLSRLAILSSEPSEAM